MREVLRDLRGIAGGYRLTVCCCFRFKMKSFNTWKQASEKLKSNLKEFRRQQLQQNSSNLIEYSSVIYLNLSLNPSYVQINSYSHIVFQDFNNEFLLVMNTCYCDKPTLYLRKQGLNSRAFVNLWVFFIFFQTDWWIFLMLQARFKQERFLFKWTKQM